MQKWDKKQSDAELNGAAQAQTIDPSNALNESEPGIAQARSVSMARTRCLDCVHWEDDI